MSGIMRATPLWFGAISSNKHFLPLTLAVVINNTVEQMQGEPCDKLKYVQANITRYKRVKISLGKSGQFVQETLFRRGKT